MTLIGDKTAYDANGFEVSVGDTVKSLPRRDNNFINIEGDVEKISHHGDDIILTIVTKNGEFDVDTDHVLLVV